MRNLAVKGISLILVVLMLAFSLASCGKGDEKKVSLTGEIGADAMKKFSVMVWTGEGNKSDSVEYLMRSGDDNTYEQFINMLGQGNRINEVLFGLKDIKELEGKNLTKVSFTLEADRAVTLTINARYAGLADFNKTVTLEANKPQKIEIAFTGYTMEQEMPFRVTFWRLAEGTKDAEHYLYNTAEQGEWSQTIYKITDFKLFCD